MSDEKPEVILTEEEMREIAEKDRGCCFLAFYHVSKNLPNYVQVKIVCGECSIEWLCGRLDMTMQFTPIGIKKNIEIAKALPGTRH